jgi:hypothetical protein
MRVKIVFRTCFFPDCFDGTTNDPSITLFRIKKLIPMLLFRILRFKDLRNAEGHPIPGGLRWDRHWPTPALKWGLRRLSLGICTVGLNLNLLPPLPGMK